VIIEYSINDACQGNMDLVETTMRQIIQRIRSLNIPVILTTHNGMNPYFWRYGSSRNFQRLHTLYKNLANEYRITFFGAYAYFARLQEYGVYFLTELKGNMVNHPFGNVDMNWGGFDRDVASSLLEKFRL
jgi:hypothetical protein